MSQVLPDETVQLGICLFGDNNICFVQICENRVLFRFNFQTKKKTIIEKLITIIQIMLEKMKSDQAAILLISRHCIISI